MNVTMAQLKALYPSVKPSLFIKPYSTSFVVGQPIDSYIFPQVPITDPLPATGAGQTYDNTSLGALPLPDQGVGEELRLISMKISSGMLGGVTIVDRLVANRAIDLATTTPQAINTVALPSRATGGAGVDAFLVTVAQVTTVPVGAIITISYTDSAGVSGRTGTLYTLAGTVRQGVVQKFALDPASTAGGVRSVESITISASGTTNATDKFGILLARRYGTIPVWPAMSKYPVGGTVLAYPLIDPTACVSIWPQGQANAGTIAAELAIASVPI